MPESCVYFGKVRDLWNFSLTSRKITVPHQKKKITSYHGCILFFCSKLSAQLESPKNFDIHLRRHNQSYAWNYSHLNLFPTVYQMV